MDEKNTIGTQKAHSFELKFGMYIRDHYLTIYIDFDNIGLTDFLQDCKKEIFTHYG